MITCFPELYPDELLYSVYCRYRVHNAHLTHSQTCKELFGSWKENLMIETTPKPLPEVRCALTKKMEWRVVLEKHTMFPAYCRFMPQKQRNEILRILGDDPGKACRKIPIRESTKIRTLRYCPLCVAEDRQRYGETYWHRIHQICGINSCPVHGCYLMTGCRMPFNFAPAEAVIGDELLTPEKAGKVDIEFSAYMAEVFSEDVQEDSDPDIGAYLYWKITEHFYDETTYEIDFKRFGKTLINRFNGIENKIGKMPSVMGLHERRQSYPFREICMAGFALGVSPKELVRAEIGITYDVGTRMSRDAKLQTFSCYEDHKIETPQYNLWLQVGGSRRRGNILAFYEL